MFQSQPQLLEYQQELMHLISTQGTIIKDHQKKSPERNGSDEAPALHGMMGCVRHSSVSGSMCSLNVVEITGSLCVT